MLVLGFKADHRLKSIQKYFLWNAWNVLTRMRRRKKEKKGHFLYIGGRAILIATVTKLLDTKYAFYGFNDGLIETIN